MDFGYKEKFGKSSDSVTQVLQQVTFFGFPFEVVFGVQRYVRLARDRTRAVYLVLHAPTKKIKGMVLTTGNSTVPCSAEQLIQVLAHESKAENKI